MRSGYSVVSFSFYIGSSPMSSASFCVYLFQEKLNIDRITHTNLAVILLHHVLVDSSRSYADNTFKTNTTLNTKAFLTISFSHNVWKPALKSGVMCCSANRSFNDCVHPAQ